jgi:hypothetical protein
VGDREDWRGGKYWGPKMRGNFIPCPTKTLNGKKSELNLATLSAR